MICMVKSFHICTHPSIRHKVTSVQAKTTPSSKLVDGIEKNPSCNLKTSTKKLGKKSYKISI